jgi:DNA-binding SARP family transcriptional activator
MHFQILGPLRVTNGDEREIALGGAKPAAVLAMLLLRANELVSADELIEGLWDGRPPATAAKTLQVHMSRLRRALDDAMISTSSGGYSLDATVDELDALRFESLVADGSAALAEGMHARASARLRAALGLWRGEALADFRYASFAQDAIARLDAQRTVALESAVEAELGLGRHSQLIPELKFLVKRHPLSEHLRAQLMLALYRSGRQAEALGVYRAGRRILVEQLGLEPSEELRDLESAILAQDPGLAAPSQAPKRGERRSRGTLVGYENELASLEDALEQALLGQGRLALVSGEPGVGKSRLADELSAVAEARGAQVLWGRCWTGGGAPAYWPWIQVLRGLGAEREVMMPAQSDPEAARFALFDTAATFLTQAASERPLVIVLDDLHAADQATLSLLQFVAAATLTAPVLIIATYRDTQLEPSQSLSETLSELARTSDCVQLVLTGMSGEDTAHFVEVSAGVAPMPRLAAAIHETSSGNPLFVAEIVRLLRAEGRLSELEPDRPLALPRGVDQVIARRLEQLSESCRQTLSLAAVIGRQFDPHVVERASGPAADDVPDHMDAARGARLVEVADGADLRFSHDLVRQALYERLPASERRRLHGTVAQTLERLHGPRPDPIVAELAHHFAEAVPGGDADKAIKYLMLAGDQAAELSAFQEAAAEYGRAADIGKSAGAPEPLMCEIYLRRAEQLATFAGLRELEVAVAEVEARAALLPADRARDARLAVVRGHLTLLDAATLEDAEIQAAIDFFEEIGDPASAARGWWAIVTLKCGCSGRVAEALAGGQMLDCAKRAHSPGLINQALRGIASGLSHGLAPVSEALPRVRGLLAESTDDTTRGRLHANIAILVAADGRFDEARALMDQGEKLIAPSERGWLRPVLDAYWVRIEWLAGNVHRTEEFARRLVTQYEAEGFTGYLSSEMTFLIDPLIAQGRLDEAAALLERAAPWATPDDVDAHFRQARSKARLELARGNLGAAEDAAEAAVARVLETESADEQVQTLLVQAAVLLAAGRDDAARAVSTRALAIAEARENVVLAQQARELIEAPVAA